MNQTAIIILGLPRTGTTFLFKRFINAGCYGTFQKRDSLVNRVSEEPGLIGKWGQLRGVSNGKIRDSLTYDTRRKFGVEIISILRWNIANSGGKIPFVVTKHPLYSGIADIIEKELSAAGVRHLFIVMNREPLDQIVSMDAQGEYMRDLIHAKWPKRNLENLALFFDGSRDPSVMEPEERAVFMNKCATNMVNNILPTLPEETLVIDYDRLVNEPDYYDAEVFIRTGIDIGLRESIRPGKGRSASCSLDIEKVKEYLKVYHE